MKRLTYFPRLLLLIFVAFIAHQYLFSATIPNHSDFNIYIDADENDTSMKIDDYTKKISLPTITTIANLMLVLLLFFYSLSYIKLIRRYILDGPVFYQANYVKETL